MRGRRSTHQRAALLGTTTLLLTLALGANTAAYAQDTEPSSGDMASARALGQEGVKLADAGNCQEAIDKLARAEKIFHAPTTLGRLGECQVQLGKLVDGTENLNKVARESLAPGAPAAFVQAQDRAKKVLAEARPKIAKLKIAVAAPADVQLIVKVDNESIPLANLNTNRPMDPGEHMIEATAVGYKKTSAKVTLSEGGSDTVALTLEVDPNAPKPEPVAPPITNPPPQQPTGSQPPTPTPAAEPSSRVPAYAALGVGVVGVAVGSVFGLMAIGKKNELDTACGTAKQCTGDQQDKIDSGKTLGTVSTVGFVVGAVGLVAGAYLFFTSGGSATTPKTATSSSTTKKSKTTTVSPYIGVDHVGLVF